MVTVGERRALKGVVHGVAVDWLLLQRVRPAGRMDLAILARLDDGHLATCWPPAGRAGVAHDEWRGTMPARPCIQRRSHQGIVPVRHVGGDA
eukprot:6339487-Pyramimonas_sp.AAC.1